MIKGEIITTILEILQSGSEVTVDLLDIFTSSRSTSYRKIRRSLKYGPKRFKTNWSLKYQERQKFYSILNKLKNQGLIKKNKIKNQSSFWKITEKGLVKLNFLKEGKIFQSGSAETYEKKTDDKLKVVIFDIPERERRKRTWLRIALISLGFSKLQQSVWIGKNKIPSDFISDLKQKEMLDYIHIFEISKKGTIIETS